MAQTATRAVLEAPGLPSRAAGQRNPSDRGVIPRLAESSTTTKTASTELPSRLTVAGKKIAQLPVGRGYRSARASAPTTTLAAKKAAKTISTSEYARSAEILGAAGGGWIDHHLRRRDLRASGSHAAALGCVLGSPSTWVFCPYLPAAYPCMPRAFAPAYRKPRSLVTALILPSDQGGAIVTSWPRRRSSVITPSLALASTVSDRGNASLG